MFDAQFEPRGLRRRKAELFETKNNKRALATGSTPKKSRPDAPANVNKFTPVARTQIPRLGLRQAEPIKLRCVLLHMRACAKPERNRLAGTLANIFALLPLLSAYTGQPTHDISPGIPTWQVIAYGPPSGLPPPPNVTVPKPIATADALA